MTAIMIDGKKCAADIKEKLKKKVQSFDRAPKLAVILVGNNPASQIYVRHKRKAAEEVGIEVDVYDLAEVMTQDALISLIRELNVNETVDGIMVQLPLPNHIDSYAVLEEIDPDKDVDGLGSRNLGKLFSGRPGLVPCTPLACMELIKQVKPKLDGLEAVIVGRSCLVGKPVAQLLLDAQCTITQAHSHTRDLAEVCQKADIVIVAVGKAGLITKKHVKKGAVVIDVGINRLENGKICGDVDFDSVSEVAGAITPVPGGVGPMTVAMLLKNVVSVYEKKVRKE